MYLLDTNIISELRKTKSRQPDRNIVTWAESVSTASLFISVISVLELETGVLSFERRDKAQGLVLRSWLNEYALPAFAGRILPIDVAVAKCCAKLHVLNSRSDRDALIAATALVHGMTVVTRNINDFKSTGVELLNPFL